MPYFLAVIAMLLSLPVSAVICKTVDEQGNVGYSDVPAGQCQKEVKLPEYSRYAPRPVEPLPSSNRNSGEGAVLPVEYTEINVSQPAQEGTVRNATGEVPVSVALTPSLLEGHMMRVFLDGVQIQPDFPSQSAILTGVERGTHTLEIAIVRASGQEVLRAPAISFTMRKPSVLIGK